MALNANRLKRSTQENIIEKSLSLTKMAELKPSFQSIDILDNEGSMGVNNCYNEIYESYDHYYRQVYSHLLSLKDVVNKMMTNVQVSNLSVASSKENVEANTDYMTGVSQFYNLLNFQMVNGNKTVTFVKLNAKIDEKNGTVSAIKLQNKSRWIGDEQIQTDLEYLPGTTGFKEFVSEYNLDGDTSFFYLKNLCAYEYEDGNTLIPGYGAYYEVIPATLAGMGHPDKVKLYNNLNLLSSQINSKAYEADSNSGLARSFINNNDSANSLLKSSQKQYVDDKVKGLLTEFDYGDRINPNSKF
jgi:hypothetical protein